MPLGGTVLSDAVIAIDFETTGLIPQVDRATEVAALLVREGRVVSSYQTLINAGLPIPRAVTALTGITTEMLRDAPKPKEVFGKLRDFIGDLPVVAHHAAFDHSIFRAELHRAGFRREPDLFLCTKLLARRVVPDLESYKLGALASHLNVRFESMAHRAMADAEVLVQVLNALCGRIASHGFDAVDVDLLRRVIRYTPVAGASKFLEELAERTIRRESNRDAPRQRNTSLSAAFIGGAPPTGRTDVLPVREEVPRQAPSSVSNSTLRDNGRAALPVGWEYYRPQVNTSGSSAPSGLGHSIPRPDRVVPWFSEPDQVFKMHVIDQARAEGADWVYLKSHRCLVEAATGATFHVYGWPQEVGGIVIFTLKEHSPVSVDHSKVLRA